MEEKSFFGGTAYLGMPFNEKFKHLIFEGIDRYGVNYGSSRNNNVTLDVFALAEAEAARRCYSEDTIIVSSGYLSAQLVIQHFIGRYKFIYAPDTHPALWVGQPKPPEISFTAWTEYAVNEVNRSDRPVLLITNSLNNLFPEIYSFEWLTNINSSCSVCLLVDDSHGIGITGKKGEGVYSKIPKLKNIEIVVIASMAKAIGVDAGVVIGTKKIINTLRTSPVYAGASPPSPGLLFAYINASEIYHEEQYKLAANMKFFKSLIYDKKGLIYLDDYPVYLINNPHAADYLALKGITISSFAYPDPKGKLLNRVVLNSRHTREEMMSVAESF